MGKTLNWKGMKRITGNNKFSNINSVNSQGKKDIAHLLFRLGDSDLLDMNYGCDGSGSNIRKALRTFKKLGYRNARKISYI